MSMDAIDDDRAALGEDFLPKVHVFRWTMHGADDEPVIGFEGVGLAHVKQHGADAVPSRA